MKKVIGILGVVLLGLGIAFGYQYLQRSLIHRELTADLDASQMYRQTMDQSQLSPRVKKQLVEFSEQEDEQLRQIAQASKTLQEYQQKKELFLEQAAREDRVGKLLEQAQGNKKAIK